MRRFGGNLGHSILCVDDEESVLNFLRATLVRLQCDLYSATTGQDAIRVARELPRLDLLITDLVMPGTDGFEVARAVASMHRAAKVILISGFNPAPEFLRMVDNKRVFFLRKPLAPAALLNRVRALLEP